MKHGEEERVKLRRSERGRDTGREEKHKKMTKIEEWEREETKSQ